MKTLAARYDAVFNFADDDFGPLERIEALVSELGRRSLKAAFSLELRAGELRRASDARLRRLRAGGLCRVFVGLESLEAETLRRWGKAVDPAALLKAVVRCRAAGIETAVGYILWHERSTPESVREQMQTLSRYDLLDPKSALSRLIVFPGSRLYEEAGAFGPARPVSLPPRAAAAYRELESRLAPLYRLWTRAAALLPGVCCRDHLQSGGDADALRALLAGMREQCVRAVLDGSGPDLTGVAEGLDAFCAAHN
jgi:hypothetical protein